MEDIAAALILGRKEFEQLDCNEFKARTLLSFSSLEPAMSRFSREVTAPHTAIIDPPLRKVLFKSSGDAFNLLNYSTALS